MSIIQAAFAAIVGDENVLTPETEGFEARHSDPYAFDPDYKAVSPGAVLPANTSEVQAIVKAANELGVGLWVVSRGRNLGYGGAMPRRSTDWLLDLGRMNKIVSVDVELGYIVVEPGVSFFALYEYLRENDLPYWASVPDLGYGSPIGNALERGFGYSAHGEHSKYLCGLEVVLPTGELMRTGMGADAESNATYVYKGGNGPDVIGLFQQSNLGIVTQAGIWLLPKPETTAAILVAAATQEGLADLVDTIRPLQLNNTIDSNVIIGSGLAVASGIMPRAAIFQGEGPMPFEAIKAVTEKIGVGIWNAKFGIYGDDAIVKAKVAAVEAAVSSNLPDAKMSVHYYDDTVTIETAHPGDRGQLGIPSGDLIQMAAWRGGEPAHTDFSVVATTRGSEAQRLVDLVKETVNSYGLDHVGGFTMFGRHAIMLNLLAFDKSNLEEQALINTVFAELIEKADAAGFAPYRAHPAFMDRISDAYDFNDHSLRRFITTLKDAVDPRGILNAGKQGVWPKGERPKK
ncbi:FAD-binding oxidoreductase [Aurantimicrobium photophilum]|uniref:4-cresol dehydrogenase [hydroxylating] flavoprotein subunit n=1 Tax=Aurantimicrobium photophilum TaxID=1987356 RepID=A0A2Z3RZH1_9MICO|nr:FAD-binding oxidoreductase [Aurantimicrobium photophilum]AWR20663.1 4-cresol dehydrogenase [hydroxylating] flavoprotein subunit [Aurantimicrobium photophilum]